MKTLLKWFLYLSILVGIGAAIYFPTKEYLRQRNIPKWRTQPVIKGDLILVVNATGKVEPVRRVTVGASVSGPVMELKVDFNSPVTANQLMARIDPKLYQAAVQRDKAILRTREAEVKRAQAMLQQATNDEKRALELDQTNSDFISETELDQLRFARMAREAEITVSETAVEQAQAQLDNSEANLAYTEIRSPVDGIVIDRKIDTGQTLAAQFQTPEMFIVAPELDSRVHIYASVDEADIGLIRKAKEEKQPVRFTVDAYPDELFESGIIEEVRLGSKEEQNVITYPVIVETPNPGTKLLPGMTANLSFQISSKSNILKIPNAALRFYPDRKRVHPDDYPILDGTEALQEQSKENNKTQSAMEKAESNRARNRRHVWVQEGEFLRAKAVRLGMSDSRFTEMVEGEVKESDALIVGEQPKI
jgi:HlyD family secretion protein